MTPRKERPIRCDGKPEIAAKIGERWYCACCGAVLWRCYSAPNREELDGRHDSMTSAFLARHANRRPSPPPLAA